jgi:hypothetical protein
MLRGRLEDSKRNFKKIQSTLNIFKRPLGDEGA